MSGEDWTALVSGPTAARAVRIAVEVAEEVQARFGTTDTGFSLVSGAAGFAVMDAYLALALNDAATADRAQSWLRRAIAGLRDPANRRAVRRCGRRGLGRGARNPIARAR